MGNQIIVKIEGFRIFSFIILRLAPKQGCTVQDDHGAAGHCRGIVM